MNPTLTLARFPIRASEFFNYPVAVQQAVQELEDVMHAIDASINPRQGALAFADASREGWSHVQLRRKYDRWVASGRDWRTLLDARKYSTDATEKEAPLPAEFRDLVGSRLTGNQRKDKPAHRALIRQWRQWRATKDRGYAIKGYEQCPEPGLNGKHPAGWSYNNLRVYAHPPVVEMVLGRIGTAAAMKLLPGVPGTRVGARPLEYIFFDDVWLDRKVIVPGFYGIVRLLQLGCLDYASGVYLMFGQRPELPLEDGTKERLKERDMKWLVARLLEKFGYPAGYDMHLVLERGTATLREADARALYDLSGGRIKVCYTSMEGGLVLVWQERSSGNSKGKAPLESWHNLFHNECAALRGQMGKDRDHSPAALHGMEREAIMLHNAGLLMGAERAAQLIPPFADVQAAHLETLEVIQRINTREDHALEGFDKVPLWRYPGMRDWNPASRLSQVPAHLQNSLEWSARLETPMERLLRLSQGLEWHKIPSGILPRFYEDCHVIRKVENFGIRFSVDGKNYSYEPETPADALPEKTEVVGYYRPHDFGVLHLTVKGQYVATWERVTGIQRGDQQAVAKAIARKHSFLNEAVANQRRRNADFIKGEEQRMQHNWRVMAEADLVPAESVALANGMEAATPTATALQSAVTQREATQVKPSTAKEIKRDILSAEAPAEETENQAPESWA